MIVGEFEITAEVDGGNWESFKMPSTTFDRACREGIRFVERPDMAAKHARLVSVNRLRTLAPEIWTAA